MPAKRIKWKCRSCIGYAITARPHRRNRRIATDSNPDDAPRMIKVTKVPFRPRMVHSFASGVSSCTWPSVCQARYQGSDDNCDGCAAQEDVLPAVRKGEAQTDVNDQVPHAEDKHSKTKVADMFLVVRKCGVWEIPQAPLESTDDEETWQRAEQCNHHAGFLQEVPRWAIRVTILPREASAFAIAAAPTVHRRVQDCTCRCSCTHPLRIR